MTFITETMRMGEISIVLRVDKSSINVTSELVDLISGTAYNN